jgi:hypothetical protein
MLACQVIYRKCSAATPCSVPPLTLEAPSKACPTSTVGSSSEAVDAITWAYVEAPGGDALAALPLRSRWRPRGPEVRALSHRRCFGVRDADAVTTRNGSGCCLRSKSGSHALGWLFLEPEAQTAAAAMGSPR